MLGVLRRCAKCGLHFPSGLRHPHDLDPLPPQPHHPVPASSACVLARLATCSRPCQLSRPSLLPAPSSCQATSFPSSSPSSLAALCSNFSPTSAALFAFDLVNISRNLTVCWARADNESKPDEDSSLEKLAAGGERNTALEHTRCETQGQEKEVAGGENDRLVLWGSLGFFQKKVTVNMYLQDRQGGQGPRSMGERVLF